MEAPPEVEKREFGVGDFGRKIVRRHMSFSSEEELNRYLREEAPLYISYSVGYFKFPAATPMENKVLLGSDLVFEFDADEVGLFSEKDVWICRSCGSRGLGYVEKCPRCGGPVEVKVFPDPEREERLKEMVDSLVKDFLVGDLGLSRKEVSINFSGNRGYHVHVRSEAYRQLDKDARIEVAEYMTGQAIDPRYLFGSSRPCGRTLPMECVEGPSPSSRGWPGRVARLVLRVLEKGREDILKRVLGKNARVLLSNREMYSSLIRKGLWPAPSLFPLKVWVEIAREVAPLSGYIIDTATSIDIHRLIRLPDSIHGTTGLAAKRIKNLHSFDPYRDAVVLPKREITVRVDISPEFEMGGETFGPYEEETVQLPLYVAYYLIGRGVAEWSLTSSG